VAGIPTPALSFSESLPGFVFASPRLPSRPPSLPPSSSSVQGGGVGVGERREGGGEPEAPRGKLRGRAGRLAPRPREELGHLGGRRCVVVSPPAGRPSGSVLVTLVAVVACHLVSAFISSLPSAALGTFARDVTQPSGLSQSSGRLATLAATAPVAQRPGSVPLSPEIGRAGL